MKFLIVFVILLITYLGYRLFRENKLDKNLNDLVAKGAKILDVRTETEFKTGHIPGAINVSLGSLRERYTELDKNETYITYCSHGLRSVKAQSLLKERGFKNVYNGGAKDDLEKQIEADSIKE